MTLPYYVDRKSIYGYAFRGELEELQVFLLYAVVFVVNKNIKIINKNKTQNEESMDRSRTIQGRRRVLE